HHQPGQTGFSMRSRLRTPSGPNATRTGRPLELVRFRGAQRDTGPEGRSVARSRRRGGRGRRRGTSRPAPPPPRRSWLAAVLAWVRSLLAGPSPTTRAATLGEQERRTIAEFERHFGIAFRDAELLKLALTHRSYLSVTGQGPRESNERLEFLG